MFRIRIKIQIVVFKLQNISEQILHPKITSNFNKANFTDQCTNVQRQNEQLEIEHLIIIEFILSLPMKLMDSICKIQRNYVKLDCPCGNT